MLILVFSNVKELHPDNLKGILFGSLVKKNKDGYLVSILPRKSKYDFKGLEKYLERISKEPHNAPFLLSIDKKDYKLIENKYNFHLDNKISIFGSRYHGYYVTRAEKYYLQYDMVGDIHIEDVLAFVKGNQKLDEIQPVWAKDHQNYDETFKWTSLKGRTIGIFGNKNTDLLSKIHKLVLNKLNKKAKAEGLDFSIIDEVSEYKEKVYEVRLLPKLGKNFLVIVNGLSNVKNFKFCLVILVGNNFDIVEEIIPTTILNCSFEIDHIYYSKDLNKDIIIGTYRQGMGGRVYLILAEEGKIKKITISSWHGC